MAILVLQPWQATCKFLHGKEWRIVRGEGNQEDWGKQSVRVFTDYVPAREEEGSFFFLVLLSSQNVRAPLLLFQFSLLLSLSLSLYIYIYIYIYI